MAWFSKKDSEEKKKGEQDVPPVIQYYNQEIERLFYYHERTKHTYQSVNYNSHYLDWDNQPDPFRNYSGVPVIPLPRKPDFPEEGTLKVLGGINEIAEGYRQPPLTLLSISQLLYYSMAISAWKQVRDSEFRYSLRVNPSSGNLHPTETHLAIKGIPEIPDGLYHYRVNEHALEQRGVGDFVKPLALLGNAPWAVDSPIVITFTSIFWRESWKYQDRAYRYCLHDLGHACGSLLAAAKVLGLTGYCLGHFPDGAVAKTLGLVESDEQPLMMIPLGGLPKETMEPNKLSVKDILALVPQTAGEPNLLSKEEVPYYALENMHIATRLPEEITSPPSLSLLRRGSDKERGEGENIIQLSKSDTVDKPLKLVSRTRRSALEFNPEINMTLENFGSLMYYATRGFRTDFRNNLFGGRGCDFITLYLYIHRVEGIERGVYQYNPEAHSLKKVKEGDQRSWAAGLSLGQSIASNCIVAFSMIADLKTAAEVFGNRGYRYVHCEAGFIGQGLYLGAEALGLNATGIGAFFDDDVHKYLAIPKEQGQVIYHFTVGKAVLDDRLIQIGDDPLDLFTSEK